MAALYSAGLVRLVDKPDIDLDRFAELASEWTHMPDSDVDGDAWWRLVDFVSAYGTACAALAEQPAEQASAGSIAVAAAQANAIIGFAEAVVDIGLISDPRFMAMAELTANRVLAMSIQGE